MLRTSTDKRIGKMEIEMIELDLKMELTCDQNID